jgi:hypothetical protein
MPKTSEGFSRSRTRSPALAPPAAAPCSPMPPNPIPYILSYVHLFALWRSAAQRSQATVLHRPTNAAGFTCMNLKQAHNTLHRLRQLYLR